VTKLDRSTRQRCAVKTKSVGLTHSFEKTDGLLCLKLLICSTSALVLPMLLSCPFHFVCGKHTNCLYFLIHLCSFVQCFIPVGLRNGCGYCIAVVFIVSDVSVDDLFDAEYMNRFYQRLTLFISYKFL
jgi:hypothetical protein